MSTNTVSMVIGSWGSYNECNERALSSKWLDFDDYDDWDAIVEELKCEGFELDGIDEELFVQDIKGIPTSSKDWDNTHPKEIFELIKKSSICLLTHGISALRYFGYGLFVYARFL